MDSVLNVNSNAGYMCLLQSLVIEEATEECLTNLWEILFTTTAYRQSWSPRSNLAHPLRRPCVALPKCCYPVDSYILDVHFSQPKLMARLRLNQTVEKGTHMKLYLELQVKLFNKSVSRHTAVFPKIQCLPQLAAFKVHRHSSSSQNANQSTISSKS